MTLGAEADLPNDGIARRAFVDEGRPAVVTGHRSAARDAGVVYHVLEQPKPLLGRDDYLNVVEGADGE